MLPVRRLVAAGSRCSVGYFVSLDSSSTASATQSQLAVLAEDAGVAGPTSAAFESAFRAAFKDEAAAAGVAVSLPLTFGVTGKTYSHLTFFCR
jgi:hypothetical protein